MESAEQALTLRSPTFPSEWDAYFDLRWRILRQPWGQPRGSEREARGRGARKIVLNARNNVVEFYQKRGYDVIGDAETLFGVIPHVRMTRSLS